MVCGVMEQWYISVELWWTVAMMRSLAWGMYLPVLFSTHIAFFFLSVHRGPARVEVIVEGGT